VSVDSSGEFACASGLDKFDVYVWSVKTGRLLEVLAGHEAPVSSVCVSPSASGDPLLASCSWDGTLKIWRFLDSASAAETLKLNADATCCAIRPDGLEVAVATLDGTITFFDVTTAKQTGSIEGVLS
jgi:periodic tryptophan protein 2